MKHHLLTLISIAILGWSTAVGFAAEADDEKIIADIVVEGGVTLTLDTVSYYLGLEVGDPVDKEMISEGFHRLWESGLFEDLHIDLEETDEGEVILYVSVVERPFVTAVIFEGNKKVSTTSIRDKLDERGIDLPRNVPLKLAEISRIEAALQEVFDQEGYRSAAIDYEIEEITKSKRRVVFHIDEGGKVKIGEVDFVGNNVFSDTRLGFALKETKRVSFFRWFGDKIIYSKESWDIDRDNLRKFYLNHGYKDVKVGTPEITMEAKNPDADTLKKKKYRLHITVPVEEGEPYSIGSIDVKGVEVFKGESLAMAFEVKEGDTYSYKAIDAGMETIRNLYHNSGYIYAYTNEVLTDRAGADKLVDVVIDVFEGERYRLGRLEFSGNETTHDKVLRREFRISEGDWMSMGVLRSSVFKVNALGFWKLEEDPLEFDFDEENKRVNVVVKGNEVGRNDIQFGAGYSELDGFFAQAMFNTRNFLGRGETLGVSAQVGGRADYYTLSFTEPYLFDRRILLGASIFNTSQDIADYYRRTTGASMTIGLGVGTFSSVSALLAYEDVESRFAVSRIGFPGDTTGGHVRPVDPPGLEGLDPERNYEEYLGATASLTPAFNHDSRDDPFDPNRGRRFTARTRFAGGPLGGDFDYIRPELTFTMFISLTKKTVFAFNLEGGQFFPYNNTEIPLYERYRLGGDRSLRGLAYYSVRPRDEEGNYFYTANGSVMGGDRYWLANVEYQYRLGGPVKLVFFSDIGNTYHEDQGWLLSQFRKTAGIELRMFLPIFQAPIRFIYGYNLDPYEDEDTSDFQFSIGTTF